jgi:hypothetical protein
VTGWRYPFYFSAALLAAGHHSCREGGGHLSCPTGDSDELEQLGAESAQAVSTSRCWQWSCPWYRAIRSSRAAHALLRQRARCASGSGTAHRPADPRGPDGSAIVSLRYGYLYRYAVNRRSAVHRGIPSPMLRRTCRQRRVSTRNPEQRLRKRPRQQAYRARFSLRRRAFGGAYLERVRNASRRAAHLAFEPPRL